jgi:hypothetical protein
MMAEENGWDTKPPPRRVKRYWVDVSRLPLWRRMVLAVALIRGLQVELYGNEVDS